MTITLRNIETGQEPTADEMKAIRARAEEIMTNPYASPEQMEWAMMVYPEALAMMIPLEGSKQRRGY
jgi:hypothetical protein